VYVRVVGEGAHEDAVSGGIDMLESGGHE
jgi:hypothetical protein